MRSSLVSLVLLLTTACASIERPSIRSNSPVSPGADRAAMPAPKLAATALPGRATAPAVADAAAPVLVAPRRDGDVLGEPYTRLRLGAFEPAGDISALDTGFWGDVAFGKEVLSFLAIEGSVGYFRSDGSGGSHLWGIPLFVNARFSVPVLILEPYAGGGVGGIYADYAGGSLSNTDFVGAWDGFVGVDVGVGRLSLGAEYRYIKSQDTKDDFAIEGHTFSVVASLPF